MNQVDDDFVLRVPGRDPIQLEEGREAYREAIIELHNMPEDTDLAPLEWSMLLEKAANDHRRDMTATGRMGATGSDGSTYKDRIERYCRWGGSIYQAIDLGERRDPIEVVIAWLVDEGNKKRTGRSNILAQHSRHFAASFGTHIEADNCCVGLFAAQVVPLHVDEGDELGIKGGLNLPDVKGGVDDNARTRKLRNMEWKSFARRIFDLQNKIRQKPKSFIAYLERSLARFHGDIYTSEDGCTAIRTEEGPVAFIEAIEFLRS